MSKRSTKRVMLQDKQDTENSVYIFNDYIDGQCNLSELIVSTKDVERYTYVCNRKNNAGFHLVQPDGKDFEGVEIKVSERQLYGLRNNIFHEDNIAVFDSFQSMFEREQFVLNLIMDNHLVNDVLKFDEQRRYFVKLPIDNLFQYIYETLTRKKKDAKKKLLSPPKKKPKKNTISIDRKAPSSPQKATDKKLSHVNISNTGKLLKKDPKIIDLRFDDDSSKSVRSVLRTTRDNDHPLNSSLYFGTEFYQKYTDENEWSRLMFHESVEKKRAYSMSDYEQEKSHALFSCIHPLYENYELIIYNGSHRLPYGKKCTDHTLVHEGTRLKLKIPGISATNPNSYFVLFDSKLVHCGAKAMRESLLSQSQSKCMRLFAYIYQSYEGTRKKLFMNLQSGTKIAANNTIFQHVRTDMFDINSFKMCDSHTCKTCVNANKGKKNSSANEVVIDVAAEMIAKQKSRSKSSVTIKSEHSKNDSKRTTNKKQMQYNGLKRPDSYVCGDLHIHGWEVHTGLNLVRQTDDKHSLRFLRYHLEQLNGTERIWNNISLNQGRTYLKLSEMDETLKKNIILSRKYLLEECFPQLSNIIKKIIGFRDHNMHAHLLVANRGNCREQQPHKDFKRKSEEETTCVEPVIGNVHHTTQPSIDRERPTRSGVQVRRSIRRKKPVKY